jgi:hypothetical protein
MFKVWQRTWLPALLLSIQPALSMAQVGVSVSVNLAPPELPVYEQPPLPGDGYLWMPGYWYWSDDAQDYYWVPGTWVEAPEPGLLWTPGYWGSDGGAFLWHPGWWGPHVGFYGGVNYGYGYGGSGFQGGYWRGGHLFYNRSVVNVGNTHITNVYVKNVVVNHVTVNRVSYNGGNGGTSARPSAAEEGYARGRHLEATPGQRQQIEAARSNRGLQSKANHGNPAIAASARPGEFNKGVVAARGAPAHEAAHPGPAAHPAPHPASAPQEREPRAAAHPAPAPRAAPHPAPAPREREPRAAVPPRAAPPPRPEPQRARPEQKRPEEHSEPHT